MVQNELNDGIELSETDALYRVMYNASGSELAHGVVVVLDTSDSTGKSIDLPGAEGVGKIVGTVVHPKGRGYSYADGADVTVCIDGVALVNVDGTDDIAAGYSLKIRDTAGVGYKANAGTDSISCIFGTALDAYTADDSLGYINVYVGMK